MDTADRKEEIREPPFYIIPIVVLYHANFSAAVVPQLQLWHAHWLVSVSVCG
jgi:hypothetical protein